MKNIKTIVIAITTLAFLYVGVVTTPTVSAAPPTNQPQCIEEGGNWSNNRCNGWSESRACSVSGGTWRSTGDAAAAPFCERPDSGDSGGGTSVPTGDKTCGGVTTSIISCDEGGGDGAPIEETGVWGFLLLVVNILTAGVGVAALGGLIYGAVLYTASGGSPDQIKKARNVFTNVVVGIIAFAAMYAVLNFIVPGGVFQ